MDDTLQTYTLPPTAAHDACADLHAFLGRARGTPVRIDASGVRRTGARLALLLAAARRGWAADGTAFRVTAPSDRFLAGLAGLGLSAAVLGEGDAG